METPARLLLRLPTMAHTGRRSSMTDEAATAELVRRKQIQAVGAAFLRRRPLIVAPAGLLMTIVLATAGLPRAQVLSAAAIEGCMVSFFFWEALRYRRREVTFRWLFVSLVLTVLGITSLCAVTGGIRSPALPILFAPSILGLAAFGVRRHGLIMVGLLALAGAGLLALPSGWPFPPLPLPAAALIGFACLAVTALLFVVGLSGLFQAHERTGFALGRMRDEAAGQAAAHTREMASLGARLAHELKNPLAALKGLIQLEGKHAGAERSRRRFAVMETEVARLEGILADYLGFARPAADPSTQRVSALALIREVLAVLEGRGEAAGVRLAGEGEDVALAVDPYLVKQALFNLFSNALEATEAGGTVVGRVRRTGEGACIEVVDTGRGMDAEVLARMGTPFFSTRSAGTGLGVVIARRIARQHGGDLRFESRPGLGTTASLLLPLAAAEREAV
jgi:signal transduction histidine kinase